MPVLVISNHGLRWYTFATIMVVLVKIIAATPPLEDEAFIRMHSLPKGELKDRLDIIFSRGDVFQTFFSMPRKERFNKLEHAGFQALKSTNVFSHPEIPEYVIKIGRRKKDPFNIGRIRVAHRISDCVKKQGFTHIIVPEKYVYQIPGKDEALNNQNYVVLAQKLPLLKKSSNRKMLKSLSEEAIFELLWVIKLCEYYDCYEHNIVCIEGEPDKVAFIDTEPYFRVKNIEARLPRITQYLPEPYNCRTLKDLDILFSSTIIDDFESKEA